MGSGYLFSNKLYSPMDCCSTNVEIGIVHIPLWVNSRNFPSKYLFGSPPFFELRRPNIFWKVIVAQSISKKPIKEKTSAFHEKLDEIAISKCVKFIFSSLYLESITHVNAHKYGSRSNKEFQKNWIKRKEVEKCDRARACETQSILGCHRNE